MDHLWRQACDMSCALAQRAFSAACPSTVVRRCLALPEELVPDIGILSKLQLARVDIVFVSDKLISLEVSDLPCGSTPDEDTSASNQFRFRFTRVRFAKERLYSSLGRVVLFTPGRGEYTCFFQTRFRQARWIAHTVMLPLASPHLVVKHELTPEVCTLSAKLCFDGPTKARGPYRAVPPPDGCISASPWLHTSLVSARFKAQRVC